MPGWEYCVITGVQIDVLGQYGGHYPQLQYFSLKGLERIVDLGKRGASQRPPGWEKVGEGGYIAHTIARLGQEGWEMTGVVVTGTGDAMHALYFRRLSPG